MKCREQGKDSEVCEPELEGVAGDTGFDFEQPRGNAEAQERLGLEPIDIDAIDASMDAISFFADLMTFAETQTDFDGGVREFVEAVKLKAGERPIRRLTITAHGAPGALILGDQAISTLSLYSRLKPLTELAPLFGEGGHVVLNSCNVAEGEKGDQLLYVLSELFGVPVTAATRIQYLLIPGLEGTTKTMTRDEEGFPDLMEDEHPNADFPILLEEAILNGDREAFTAVMKERFELTKQDVTLLLDELSNTELPEVGDLTSWLLGP